MSNEHGLENPKIKKLLMITYTDGFSWRVVRISSGNIFAAEKAGSVSIAKDGKCPSDFLKITPKGWSGNLG
jgi:hypothetical protein